jgi:hypothetical protein
MEYTDEELMTPNQLPFEDRDTFKERREDLNHSLKLYLKRGSRRGDVKWLHYMKILLDCKKT